MKTARQYAEQALSLNSQEEMKALFKKAMEEVLEQCAKVARNNGDTECDEGHEADAGDDVASAIRRLISRMI